MNIEEASEVFQNAVGITKAIQKNLHDAIQLIESHPPIQEDWKREDGGGGSSLSWEKGDVFERAGVNHSVVFGTIKEKEKAMFKQLFSQKGLDENSHPEAFFATGISLVFHPQNPFVPTVHANFRYFECKTSTGVVWWFGGGCDLTPYYLFEEDVQAFHKSWQACCETFRPGSYQHFKQKCDRYFYLPHRKEHRGVGGIFYDYESQSKPLDYLEFTKQCGQSVQEAYWPILEKRKNMTYSDNHLAWQHYRRGRYVEFNLLYDRGTLFGLKTGGRIESILMSLPPRLSYSSPPNIQKGSPEDALMQVLYVPKEWIPI